MSSFRNSLAYPLQYPSSIQQTERFPIPNCCR
jgi:hypothetical protein